MDAPLAGDRFPKRLRIRKRREYQALQQGRRLSSAHFVFLLRARGDELPSRLGLIVSRRVGNAVQRNRVKRRSRELFRRHHRLWFGLGWDCAVLAKQGAAELSAAQTQREWQRALRQLARL